MYTFLVCFVVFSAAIGAIWHFQSDGNHAGQARGNRPDPDRPSAVSPAKPDSAPHKR